MDNKVKKSLSAALNKFATVEGIALGAFENSLLAVFEQNANFLDKVEAFDAVFDEHPKFEDLREVFFDLLMINFFSCDVQELEDDYLETPEWADIEEQTIDRGTELLNLLLYIKDCHDEEIEPELGDFLKEFLLVDEDEFQDEFHIYEDLIDNQQLAETSVEDICKTAGKLDLGEEMESLFVPFMTFFNQPIANEQTANELAEFSSNKSFDAAVYTLITNFNH